MMQHAIARYRFILLALLAPLALAPLAMVPAFAQSDEQVAALDALFARLAASTDEASARDITDQIWLRWTTPTDPILAERMRDVLSLRQRADFPTVIAMLDDITTDYPDYAEGWNQRATIFYLMGNYERSLADIDMVLAHEPRHFGALAGRAVIYETQGKHDLALRDMAAAMAIHPFLAERAMFPELLDITRI